MRLKDWKTKPIFSLRMRVRARSLSSVISVPSMLTRPLVGASKPPSKPISVDLPLPEGPMMPSISPRAISNDTP